MYNALLINGLDLSLTRLSYNYYAKHVRGGYQGAVGEGVVVPVYQSSIDLNCIQRYAGFWGGGRGGIRSVH